MTFEPIDWNDDDDQPVPHQQQRDGEPLTDDELTTAYGAIQRLNNRARWAHREASTRWRAKCVCGDRWPCREQAALQVEAQVLDKAVAELMYRRRFSRPLNGLERVQEAVEWSRGTYARPTRPILFDCRPETEEPTR